MPPLDLTPYREETGERRLPAWGERPAPTETGGWLTVVLYVVLGTFIGLLLAMLVYRLSRRQGRRSVMADRWARVERQARSRQLTAEEWSLLRTSLETLRTEHPDELVRNSPVFDEVVAPELARQSGAEQAAYLRSKLFADLGAPAAALATEEPETGEAPDAPPPPDARAPDLRSTRMLPPGQEVDLRFRRHAGTVRCRVVNATTSGLVARFPTQPARDLRPARGEAVEGYLGVDGTWFAFASSVEQVYSGGLSAIRIAHSDNLVRVPLERPVPLEREVTFAHLPAAEARKGPVDLALLDESGTERWEGIVRDMTPRGCRLETLARANFLPGGLVLFSMPTLHDDPTFTFIGHIARSEPIPTREGGGAVLEIEFVALDDAAAVSFVRAAHRLQHAPR
jgi:hypothetical protein